MFSSLRRFLKPGNSPRRSSSKRFRPILERLEDRLAPAVLNVISLADNTSAVITAGHAGTAADPFLAPSLRSAITFANGSAGGNTINLSVAGTYKITIAGSGEDNNATGDFDILPSGGSLNIVNTSGASVVVDGNHLDRVFDINPAALNTSGLAVSFQGFTIQNGLAPTGAGATGSGGGIRDQGNVSLTLTNMIIANNSANADGGGISMENAGGSTFWTLTLNSSTIANNHAGVSGGGIETDGGGTISLNSGTAITGNSSPSFGGGIDLSAISGAVNSVTITNGGSGYTSAPTVTFSAAPSGGTTATGVASINASGQVTGVTLTNSGTGYTAAPTVTFSAPPPGGTTATGTATIVAFQSATLSTAGTLISNNSAFDGGGIENDGNGVVTISGSTVENNSGVFGGGFGDQNRLGRLTVTNSYFFQNYSMNFGGGISAGGPTTTITNSIIANNTSSQNTGGGIFAYGVTLTIQASTISGNSAIDGGSGVEIETTGIGSSITNTTITGNNALNGSVGGNGGGIDAATGFTGTLKLLNDTINGNFATNGGGIFWAGTTGSAITVQNTIIAGNQAGTTGPDANNAAGAFVDLGGNLIGVAGTGSGNTGFNPVTSQTGTVATPLDPLLGALQFNGGTIVGATGATAQVTTEFLRPHSPAIDKGLAAGSPTSDERGFARPDAAGENPDVGAFESQVKENSVFFLKTDNSLWQTTAGGTATLLSPAGTILSIASVTDDAGFDVVFAITSDTHLWEHSDELPGAGWQLLSVGSFQSITAAVNQAGNAVVAGVLTDNSLWENSSLFPAGHWANLSPAGTILSASAATDTSQGFSQDIVYAITSDTHLWKHAPSGWSMVSSSSFQQISAGFNSAGQAVVYGVLTDNSLTEFNPALSGGSLVLSGAGTILSVSAGTSDQVFAITSDHHLWTHTLAGWSLLSVGSFQSISGNQTTSGTGEVFGVLSDTSLWEFNPAFPGSHWQNIVSSGVLAASAPLRY